MNTNFQNPRKSIRQRWLLPYKCENQPFTASIKSTTTKSYLAVLVWYHTNATEIFKKDTQKTSGIQYPLQCKRCLTWWYLAYGCWMPTITLVAVGRLDKYWRITETLGKHFSTNVIQTYTLPNVPPCLFYHCIAIHIWQKAQAKPFWIAWIYRKEKGLTEQETSMNNYCN